LYTEHLTKQTSELHCPVCKTKQRLLSRRFGDFPISVLECQGCAGLWLGLDSLEEIFTAEARTRQPALGNPIGPGTDQVSSRRSYIPCVICGDFMSRRHIAQGKSGIVVDLCGHHGVWFDSNELAQLIAWTRTGGLEDVRRDFARLIGSKDTVRKRHVINQARSSPVISAPAEEPAVPVFPGRSYDAEWIQILGGLAVKVLLKGIRR
jgi:Zn-finger nucleic acid-binding protein